MKNIAFDALKNHMSEAVMVVAAVVVVCVCGGGVTSGPPGSASVNITPGRWSSGR